MTVDSILQKFELFGVKLGLESSFKLLAALGNPQQSVPIVHVAGSNGKGSVCAYLASVLTEAGYKTGRFTSPHLIDWTERICINNRAIAPTDLVYVLQQVIAAIDPQEPSPTQFEVITAAMWLYFAQQQVDVAVVEVGLGGRLDCTNVCDRPLVSIITSLSLEHWQRLGPTLADIAGEKAGILKPHCPAVLGQFPTAAQRVVERRLADLAIAAIAPAPATDLGDGWAEFQGIRYRLPLQGAIQLQNSAVAITALKLLQSQGWQISDRAIAQGIARTEWPARIQWHPWHGHKILIDGAHNPDSARVLRQFVDRWLDHTTTAPAQAASSQGQSVTSPCTVHWIIGMLSTKDHGDIFRALLRAGDRLYLVPVPGHSSADPQQLATLAQQICPDLSACSTYSSVTAALEAAVPNTALTVLCGSLYLIGCFLGRPDGATQVS
jgi:dihydrofolate synthase / folylpolyglutamate synthase